MASWKDMDWQERLFSLQLNVKQKGAANNIILAMDSHRWELAVPRTSREDATAAVKSLLQTAGEEVDYPVCRCCQCL